MTVKDKFVCQWCRKGFETALSLRGHSGRCKIYAEFRQESISEEKLRFLYLEEERSCVEIAEILGLKSFGPVYSLMEKYGIPRRSLSEAANCKRSKTRRAETAMRKYGSPHNFCKDHPSRQKWEQRLLEKEGITNVFQRKDVIDKIQKTIAERYPDEDPRYRPVRGRRVYSKLHKKIVEILIKLGYEPRIERKFYNFQDRHRILYSFDIYIEPNLLIEVNGNMWHANPKIYKPDDLIPHYQRGYFPAKEKWELDRQKIEYAEKKGFSILVIWESDIDKGEEFIINILQRFIKEKRYEGSKDKKYQEVRRKK